MRIAFLHSDKPREHILADAFLRGAARHGHDTTAIPLGQPVEPGAYDVVCMVGVKSRELFQAHHRVGAHVIYFDKGYSRHKLLSSRAGWEYWRIAIDAHHPTAALAREELPRDRFDAMGWEIKPWRRKGGTVIIAGSSAKYHEFYGLREPNGYAQEVVRQIRARTEAYHLVYRPKPSWKGAVPITKAAFSELPETLGLLLTSAHVLVTHGSNSCFEAAMAGVPSIVLGNGVAAPISSTTLDDIEEPRLAHDRDRLRWARNVAWWQWTESEMASGAAWDFIGDRLHAF